MRPAHLLLAAFVLAHAAFFSFVSAIKYRYYLYDDFDLAIFTQAVHGLLSGSTYSSVRGMHWLGDHASLILFPVAALLAFLQTPIALLGLQSIVLGLGAIAVYRLSTHELKDERFALAFSVAYLMYPAVAYTNLFEFHPETLATTALLFTFLHARKSNLRRALTFGVIAMACREDVAALVLLFAIFAAVRSGRSGLAIGAGLGVLALLSLVISFGIVMPAFNQGEAEHGLRYGAWGNSLPELAKNLVRQPLAGIGALFGTPSNPLDHAAKQQYWFHMLLPLGFLPLLCPEVLVLALPILLEHFLSARVQQHSIVYQYTALVTPVFVLAAILAAKRISSWSRPAGVEIDGRSVSPRRGWTIALLLAGSLGANVLFGPFGAGIGQTVRMPQRALPTAEDVAVARHRDRLLDRLPRSSGVVAGFEFLPHLATQANVHSAHHVLAGHYTMSTRSYPTPTGIGGVLVDLSPRSGTRALSAEGVERMAGLLRANSLVPVDVVDGNVLCTRHSKDAPPVWEFSAAGERSRAIVYDHRLALVNARTGPLTVSSGETVSLWLTWERIGSGTSPHVLEFVWFGPDGRVVHSNRRYLGYGLTLPAAWPLGESVTELSRIVVPAGVRPGHYGLGLRVLWREDMEMHPSQTSSPLVSVDGILPLAQLEVTAAL